MTAASPVTPAHALLDVVLPRQAVPPPTDAQADMVVRDYLALVEGMERKHAKQVLSEDYLSSWVFGRGRELKNDAEEGAYCRSHLKVAVRQFKLLLDWAIDKNAGVYTVAGLAPWKEVIIDYVFDLAEIIPFFERKTPGFVYLRGHKNSDVHSWEIFVFARQLIQPATNQGSTSHLNHKVAHIASIFVLRQALELRFERLVGVYPRDKKGHSPRLRHSFYQEFIEGNPSFFRAQGFSFRDLRPVYEWCSEVVHLAYQPYAWQSAWAHEISGRLLGALSVPAGHAWNIANAVEVTGVSEMQATFESHFLEQYDHGSWRMTRMQPEALVREWDPSMAFTASDFRHVVKKLT